MVGLTEHIKKFIAFYMLRIFKITSVKFHFLASQFFLISFFLLIEVKAQPIFETKEKAIFEILYFANLNGNIENCHCGDPPLGGLDRISTIIKKHRELNPGVIVIDGGDTFNTYPFEELNTAIVKSYQEIKPDIWLLSEQEFIEGESFLVNAVGKINTEIISTNYSIKNISSKRYKKFSFGEQISVFIYTYLQPDLFPQNEKRINFNRKPFSPSIKSLNKKNFNILVYHGEEDFLAQNTDQFQNFNLILLAHEQAEQMSVNSKPLIIGAGADGENIVHISLHKSDDRINIKAERINVSLEIEPDPKIEGFISDYKKGLKN